MEYTSIGESCSVVSGGTPSRSKNEYWENGNIPWIKIGNIKSKYVNEYDELITEQGLNNSSAKLLKKGTILYTIFATLGEVGILDIEACTNQAIAGINITDPRITTDYLYYYLKSKKDYVNNIGRGVAQNNINLTTLKNFEIPLIDVDKQSNIVEILEKVERMICLKEKEIDDLDLLIKARFIEMFGDPYTNPLKWEKLKIKDAVTVEPQNGLYKPQSDYVTDRSGIPILRIDGFYDGIVTDFASLKRLKCSETEKQKYLLLEDDIVINRVNSIEYLGKCAHIKGLLEDTVYESNMMRMHFDPETYNSAYICKLLCSQFIYDQIVNHAKKAVNQASINQKDVLDFNIYQPPIDLQNQFADFIQQVDKSREAVKKSLEKTQQLYDSLMQEYFG
ncbi:restriction endonuclease subunit S [Holdemanella biformis]|uniref:restriction endonuclease subunit S n=1 Tax=Holdemanella biformis TaxID=1735 RepID=UPI000E4D2BBD|nr:restriction endonuclease subunit S [Holdemanella biformis]RGU68537.1 restriction endonuclease subunit S [Holdemanella biformis]